MMASTSNDTTPLPYQQGEIIELDIIKNCGKWPLYAREKAKITFLQPSMTMPVMNVVLQRESGPGLRAILKLFDRRHGSELRLVRTTHDEGVHKDFTAHLGPEDDEAFHSFVRDGKMEPFLKQHAQREKELEMRLEPYRFRNNTSDPDARAKYEAALWLRCDEFFDAQTRMYERLSDVQGISVPRMYGHVRVAVAPPRAPADLMRWPETAQYLEVKGVLLQAIDGYRLSEMHTPAAEAMVPEDRAAWGPVVQSALDVVYGLHMRGVCMPYACPRDVLVDRHTQTPFVVDLSQGMSKEEVVKACSAWYGGPRARPESVYWKAVETFGPVGRIEAMMSYRLKGKVQMNLECMPCDGTISETYAERMAKKKMTKKAGTSK